MDNQILIVQDRKQILELLSDAIFVNKAIIADEVVKKLEELSTESPEWISRSAYAKKHGISISMCDKLRRTNQVVTKKVGRRRLFKNL